MIQRRARGSDDAGGIARLRGSPSRTSRSFGARRAGLPFLLGGYALYRAEASLHEVLHLGHELVDSGEIYLVAEMPLECAEIVRPNQNAA